MIQRGQVRWYRFAQPDKRRPVVVLTRNAIIPYLGEVTVAPITSTIREIASEVALTDQDGMPRTCAINLDHVQTVSRGRIEGLITTLSTQKMEALRLALLFALGFDDRPLPQGDVS